MNKVLAIVVTYNRLNMLQECILHLMKQTCPCDIMIVDNNSTDNTSVWCVNLLEFIKHPSQDISVNLSDQNGLFNMPGYLQFFQESPENVPVILYENTGANLGGAGGFNYGMKRCVELGYDYAWVMDDDAFAEDKCLEELMAAGRRLNHNFGFLSSAVIWTDGTLCRMNWQRKYDLPKDRNLHHLCDSDLSADMIRIQSSTFVSALFPVSVIKKAGLPIKEFFIWCDDIEYTRRIALKHSLPCYVIPASRIVHHIKNNEGTNLATDDADRIPRYNYAFRNENYMYRQYGIKGFCYYLIVIVYNTFKVLTRSPDRKLARLKVIYKNLFTGLFFNPKVEFPQK